MQERSHVLLPGAERRLGGRQSGDRDAEGGAGDVIQARLVAEDDRGRVAAVLAADADRQVRPRRPPLGGRQRDQPADAGPVQLGERVGGQDAALQVLAQELLLGVVTRGAMWLRSRCRKYGACCGGWSKTADAPRSIRSLGRTGSD